MVLPRIGFAGLLQRESVRDESLWVDAPLHDSFHQLLHLPNGGHPAAVDGLLRVDDAATYVEADAVSLSYEADLAPLIMLSGAVY